MRRLVCALVAPAVLSAAPAAGAQPAPAAPAPAAPAPAAPAPAAPAEPRPRSPTFHDASHGWLRVTRAPALTHPALGTFDLYCPQTPHPSPFVVVVLDPAQPRAEGEGEGQDLAEHGFGAIVLEPAQASAERVAAAIDALLADTATDRSEPGCRADGRVAVLGILRGGPVALAVAREREGAGQPLAAVATVLAARGQALAAPPATPTLFVESQRIAGAGGTQIVVDQAIECDVRSSEHPCWRRFDRERDPERANEGRTLAARRQLALGDAAVEFLRATIERDETSQRKIEYLTQQPAVQIKPEVTHLAAEYRALLHVGGLAGVSIGSSAELALAARPEVVLARVREAASSSGTTRAIGVGIYGEAARIGGVGALGAGITVTSISGRFGIATSIGMLRREGAASTALSLFLGFRDAEDLPPLDLASGLRIDLRSLDGEIAVAVSLQLDLMLPVIGIAGLIGLGDTIAGKR